MNILCLCIGNKDRSPIVAAFLRQMLANKGLDINQFTIDTAGVNITTREGKPAPELAVKAAKIFGLDISKHRQRYIGDIDLGFYKLAIVADFMTQVELMKLGFSGEVINLNLEGRNNAWMSQDPRKVDDMVLSIMTAVARDVIQYKCRE